MCRGQVWDDLSRGRQSLLRLWCFGQASDLRLALYVLVGALATLVILSLAGWLLIKCVTALRSKVGIAWRFGIANIARRPRASTLQIVAFGLGLMMLLLLSIVRNDILDEWDAKTCHRVRQTSSSSTCHRTMSIRLRGFLSQHDVEEPQLYPMIRGRLTSINGRPVEAEHYADPRAQRLATREFNLSWSETLKKDNRLVAGTFWSPGDTTEQFSVEEGLAETLGIELGDELVFAIAGSTARGRVTNLRFVEWDSFRRETSSSSPPGPFWRTSRALSSRVSISRQRIVRRLSTWLRPSPALRSSMSMRF